MHLDRMKLILIPKPKTIHIWYVLCTKYRHPNILTKASSSHRYIIHTHVLRVRVVVLAFDWWVDVWNTDDLRRLRTLVLFMSDGHTHVIDAQSVVLYVRTSSTPIAPHLQAKCNQKLHAQYHIRVRGRWCIGVHCWIYSFLFTLW